MDNTYKISYLQRERVDPINNAKPTILNNLQISVHDHLGMTAEDV